MYKTYWSIDDQSEKGHTYTDLIVYHFGKTPRFPHWYMEKHHSYTIEMIWNFKLSMRPYIFFKCLTHQYIIQ